MSWCKLIFVTGNLIAYFLRIDPEKLLFGVKLFTPVYSFTSQYRIRIKLGLLDVQGEGDVKGELSKFNPLDMFFSLCLNNSCLFPLLLYLRFLLLYLLSFLFPFIFRSYEHLVGLNVNLRIQLGTQGNSVKLVKFQNRVKIDKGKYHFSNLFNGNNVLSQVSQFCLLFNFLLFFDYNFYFQGWKRID